MATTCDNILDNEGNLSQEAMPSFYERMKQCVFRVSVALEAGGVTFSGTGVSVSSAGHILTCYHVIKGFKQVYVSSCSTKQAAVSVVHSDKSQDLALLRLRSLTDIPFVQLHHANDIKVGMPVISIAHPRGLEYTFTIGEVAYPTHSLTTRKFEDLGQQFLNRDSSTQLIQINNVHTTSGASGGPIFNTVGHLVGLQAITVEKFLFAIHPSALASFTISAMAEPQSENHRRSRKKVRNNKKPQAPRSLEIRQNLSLGWVSKGCSSAKLKIHQKSKKRDENLSLIIVPETLQASTTISTKMVRISEMGSVADSADIAERCVKDLDDMCDSIKEITGTMTKLLEPKANMLAVQWALQVSPTTSMKKVLRTGVPDLNLSTSNLLCLNGVSHKKDVADSVLALATKDFKAHKIAEECAHFLDDMCEGIGKQHEILKQLMSVRPGTVEK